MQFLAIFEKKWQFSDNFWTFNWQFSGGSGHNWFKKRLDVTLLMLLILVDHKCGMSRQKQMNLSHHNTFVGYQASSETV